MSEMVRKIRDTRVANSRKKSSKVETPTTKGMQRTEGMPSNPQFFAYNILKNHLQGEKFVSL
jgi:hypothetical protein